MARCGHGGAIHVVEAPDHGEVLPAGEVLVHRRVLAGQSDERPDLIGLGDHVVPEDTAGAPVGGEDGGEDADGRRLAGAVGPQQAEDGALLDREAHAVEGAHVTAEGLSQIVGLDGVGHGEASLLRFRGVALGLGHDGFERF